MLHLFLAGGVARQLPHRVPSAPSDTPHAHPLHSGAPSASLFLLFSHCFSLVFFACTCSSHELSCLASLMGAVGHLTGDRHWGADDLAPPPYLVPFPGASGADEHSARFYACGYLRALSADGWAKDKPMR